MESTNKIAYWQALTMHNAKNSILRFIEICGGFKVLRWRNRHAPQVLMYHRIIEKPFIAGLPPTEFEKQIAYLAKHFRVVPIDTLITELNQKKVQPFTIALTFDDGHFDFYENAWPILKKYRLPASLYITTGFVNGTLWLWPDLLKFAMLNSANKHVNLPLLGDVNLSAENFSASWHRLGDYCLTLGAEARFEFIQNFATQAGVILPQAPVAPFTSVTWPQLHEMQKEGLDIGSHTVSHPILSSLLEHESYEELCESARSIEHHLGRFPRGVCYPNGRLSDVNDKVISQAKGIGYTYGLLARNTIIDKNRPFLIGRLASHSDFMYFKWTLNRHAPEQQDHYIL